MTTRMSQPKEPGPTVWELLIIGLFTIVPFMLTILCLLVGIKLILGQ